MSVESYRTEVTAKLVKLDERQISIFKTLQRIEKHLMVKPNHILTTLQLLKHGVQLLWLFYL